MNETQVNIITEHFVSQKGIFKTDGRYDNCENRYPELIKKYLKSKEYVSNIVTQGMAIFCIVPMAFGSCVNPVLDDPDRTVILTRDWTGSKARDRRK